MDWRHVGELLTAGKQTYDTLLNLCVWTKDNGGMGSLYRSQHELVFVFRKGLESHRNNIRLGKFGRNRTNVWRYPGVNTLSRSGEEGNLLALHPTVKPVAMIADAILDCSAPGDIVLDNFCGVGSTILAAERVGRSCYAIEIDSLYVDTAVKRWEKRTGKQAVRAASGKDFEQAEVANVPKLSEIAGKYGNQSVQQAAIRGLLTIGTPPAILAVVERLYRVWGVTTLQNCIRGLAGMKDHLGLVALAATMFWDDRFVAQKLAALVKGLDSLCDIRSFVESQSRDGKISLFSITAALQLHTTPEVAAAFDYSLPIPSAINRAIAAEAHVHERANQGKEKAARQEAPWARIPAQQETPGA